MPVITHSITIEAPVEFVFSFLANFENRPRFEYGVSKVERLTDGPIGVGTHFREVRKFMGRETTTVHELVEYVRERTISFRSISGPMPVEGTYSVNPLGESTRLTFTLVISPRGLLAPFGRFIAWYSKRDLERYYRVLKALMENPAYVGY